MGPWFETRGAAALLAMRDHHIVQSDMIYDLILMGAILRVSRRMKATEIRTL